MIINTKDSLYFQFAHELEDIQTKIYNERITLGKREKILGRLDHLVFYINDEERTLSSFFQILIQSLKQKIFLLYGELDHLFCKYELDLITQQTARLKKALKKKYFKEVLTAITNLKSHMTQLRYLFTLNLEERRVLVLANDMVHKGEAFLNCKTFDEKPIQIEECLKAEKFIEDIFGFSDESFDPEYFKILWNSLSHSLKELVGEYLEDSKTVIGSLFEENFSTPNLNSIK